MSKSGRTNRKLEFGRRETKNEKRETFLFVEKSKIQLEQIVEEKFKAEQVFKSLEQDRIRLETELDLVKRELDEKNRDLNKERTRIENFIRQEQVRLVLLFDSRFIKIESCGALINLLLSVGMNVVIQTIRLRYE